MVCVYTLEKSEEWDNIVRSFENFDVYYLSGYVKAFKINGDGEPVLIYFKGEKTRAINVVIKRDLSDFTYFKGHILPGTCYDIVTPYGYGGWLTEGNDYNCLKQEYEDFCRRENIVCEFVRFHPMLKNWNGLNEIYDEIHLGTTVYMDTSSKEVIWHNIISKNRNIIRKAQKSGLEVYWGRDGSIIEPFMNIYNATMDKDMAEDYYYFKRDFYESVLNDLKYNSMWFYAKKDDEIAAIAIFMFANGNMHYHLSASRREFQNLAPTNLLLYEAALWASENGYSNLHMGGGVGSSQDSLYKFKKAFNRGDDMEFHIGKRIFIEDRYDELVELRKTNDETFNEESKFFPLYRG